MQSLSVNINQGQQIYFASDLHLGAPNASQSLQREKHFVKWLNEIEKDAAALFLVGDVFDYWFEYKHFVPSGYVRLLGKLANMVDAGIQLFVFTGNHDLWMKNYFEKEIGAKVFFNPIELNCGEVKMLVGHGDGLGPGDYGYKWMKKVFTNPICIWLYQQLHPDFSYKIATFFSRRSREKQLKNGADDFNGIENEWLYQYAQKKLKTNFYNYFIFGHRHLPLNEAVTSQSNYINLGDWINHYSYAKFNGQTLKIAYFKP